MKNKYKEHRNLSIKRTYNYEYYKNKSNHNSLLRLNISWLKVCHTKKKKRCKYKLQSNFFFVCT